MDDHLSGEKGNYIFSSKVKLIIITIASRNMHHSKKTEEQNSEEYFMSLDLPCL